MDKIKLDEQIEYLVLREEHEKRNFNKDYAINRKLINSSEYDKKFAKLDEPQSIIRVIKREARKALENRNGTDLEDLIYVDSITGRSAVSHISKTRTVKPTARMNKMLSNAKEYTIIGIHTHPNSFVPSGQDIYVCRERRYKYGLVIGHNGSVYKYTVPENIDASTVRVYNIEFDSFFGKQFYNISDFFLKIKNSMGVEIREL